MNESERAVLNLADRLHLGLGFEIFYVEAENEAIRNT